MKRISLVVSVVLVASVVMGACGGAGGAGAAGAAKAWFEAFSQLDLNKVKDLTCDKEKASLEQAFAFLGGTGSDTDLEALKELFQIDVAGLKYEEKNVSGSTATVYISGVLKVSALGQAQEQNIDEDVPVVNEGGTWKVCAASLPGN